MTRAVALAPSLVRNGNQGKSGADDYLTKPFAFDELIVRLEALLRRSADGAQIDPC